MPRRCLITAFALLLATALTAYAADKNKTYTSPEAAKADPDFAVQGEYVGEVKGPDGQTGKIGVQVIALGGGKFDAKMFLGGLPGEGADMKSKKSLPGMRDGDKVVFANQQGKVEIVGDTLTAYAPSGQAGWSVKKVHRKSPTLGAKPPKDAVVLFNGTKDSLKNWKKGANITDDGLLMQGVTSLPTFGSHTLHIEFRTPYKPNARGQGRGNSGLYVQGRYEVQMLDSFGLAGKNNECGGIYSIKDPDLNMCYPPLSWQTYDIDFTAAKFDGDGKKIANARMTVRHNGVVVHDDVELPKTTTAAPNRGVNPSPGPVYLQNHGNPVWYRNIWVVKKD